MYIPTLYSCSSLWYSRSILVCITINEMSDNSLPSNRSLEGKCTVFRFVYCCRRYQCSSIFHFSFSFCCCWNKSQLLICRVCSLIELNGGFNKSVLDSQRRHVAVDHRKMVAHCIGRFRCQLDSWNRHLRLDLIRMLERMLHQHPVCIASMQTKRNHPATIIIDFVVRFNVVGHISID